MEIGLLKLAGELHKNKTFKNVKSIMDMGNKSIRCNYKNLLYLFDQPGIDIDKRKFNFLKKFPLERNYIPTASINNSKKIVKINFIKNY